MNRVLAAAMLAAPFAMGHPAFAEPPLQDQVTFEVQEEAWVETDTARAIIAVNAAATGANAAKMRADMQDALKRVLPDATWRITSFNQSRNAAGLDAFEALAEARVKNNATEGLSERAKSASRQGLQITVAGIDFSPGLAEIETAKAELREAVYKRALAERDRLNKSLPDRAYRIARIDFSSHGVPPPMPAPYMRAEMAASSAKQAPDIAVTEKLYVQASVTLSVSVPSSP
jgi:uncharacterized protein YggE